jgi:hypothetical protein
MTQKPQQSREYKTGNKMLEELYMRDLANAMRMPEEVVPAGKVTVSAPEPEMAGMDKAFVGTRLNVPKPGQPTQQDREKMAIGLLDTLAGALRGAAAQVGGLPGDIRSILDMINQEGAEKYLGQRSFATTEEILKDTSVRVPSTQIDVPFPPVLKEGVPNRAERQKAVDVAQEVGTFLPAPGIPEAAIQGVKAVGKAIKATKNMPVGMSTQAVGQGMDELGFYSAAKQAVDAIQQPKGTGAQFLAQISKTPGVKPDEIKWTGLDEFLQSKKSVTKAEVQEYLDKNRVEIKEVTLGSGPNPYPYRTADEWQGAIDRAEKARDFDEAERLTNAWEAFEGLGMDDQTKFSKYTLPGGDNYREILLTLPAKEVMKPTGSIVKDGKDAEYPFAIMVNGKEVNRVDSMEFADEILQDEIRRATGKIDKAAQFKSGHFDQPNILAHLRVNDRVIDGKKTLFVEEVQSDWHQAGRKKGYQSQKSEYETFKNSLVEKYKVEDLLDLEKVATPEEYAKFSSLLKDESKQLNRVPDAPFKTTWSDLSMKRVIQMASEGGYDRIAFTTGKTQAERYDLSKQISRVNYTEAGVLRAFDKDGKLVISKKLDSPDQIEDYIGKEPAKRLLEQDVKGVMVDEIDGKPIAYGNPNVFDGRELSGVELSVGGEGMKGFYDDILPKFLNKYAKKWDAKVGQTEIEVGKGKPTNYADFDEYQKAPALSKVSVNYIDVTPKMRESVVTKGQPMFAIGAGGAGAAATQEENE